ncbi:MAG: Gfo/Idh/MocA family protein [Christensenellales bacterium]
MLKVGIIGCGRIAQLRHAPEYAADKDCRLTGLYDNDFARAQELALQYDATAFETLEGLLDSGVDALSVCSANTAHAEATIQALRRGIHVLCEKPMATTLHDCEEMARAQLESGKVLMLGHNQRFAAAHIAARQLISQGRIGRVLTFRTTFGHPGPEGWTGLKNSWFFDKSRAAFGVLADLGIHKTDLIHFLLGESIVEVSAKLCTIDKKFPDGTPITVDDNALCLLTTAGGVTGSMHVSWTFYGREDNATRIYGEEGILRLYDDPQYALILERKDGTREDLLLDQLATNKDQTSGKRRSTGVIDAFLDSIRRGVMPGIDGREALKAMRVIFAAEASAREGRSVRIRQDD